MKHERIVLLILILTCASFGQQSSSVSGKVSLITQGGELKPARLAQLFLLTGTSGEGGPAMMYLRILQKKVDKAAEELARERSSPEADACRMVIIAVEARSETLAASKDSPSLQDQVQIIQADEEGLFRFPVVARGAYVLLAFGRAGMNEAYWQEPLKIESGKDVELKLRSPKVSCFMSPN